jgi:hypothetical protein
MRKDVRVPFAAHPLLDLGVDLTPAAEVEVPHAEIAALGTVMASERVGRSCFSMLSKICGIWLSGS